MNTARNLLLVAAFVSTAQMAAALTAQELATSLQSQGYGYIAIETGTTQLAVRAYKDGQSVSAVYDKATGALLATRSEPHAAPSGTDSGVRLRTEDRDFVTLAADGSVTPLGRDGTPRADQNPKRDDRAERPHNGTDDDRTASRDLASHDADHGSNDRPHDRDERESEDDDHEGDDHSAENRDDHGRGHGDGGRSDHD